MKKIKLISGEIALIDNEDFEIINLFKWYLMLNYNKTLKYAYTPYIDNRKQKTLLMHRLIINAKNGEQVDHIDGNGLNNCKCNLRFCTYSQNHMNRKKRRGKSKFKGVSLHSYSHKWQAKLTFKKKCHYLGLFKNEQSAAEAYNKKAKELFGEFSKLNNI